VISKRLSRLFKERNHANNAVVDSFGPWRASHPHRLVGERKMMKPTTRRFLVILVCVTAAFFVGDYAITGIRTSLQQRMLGKIKVGLPEADVIRILGGDTFYETNSKHSITVWECQSASETLLSFITGISCRSGNMITISSGRVERVDFQMMTIL
jgi:hypothetical protein